MTARAQVAVLRTRPETVLQDYQRLFELAGGPQAKEKHIYRNWRANTPWGQLFQRYQRGDGLRSCVVSKSQRR